MHRLLFTACLGSLVASSVVAGEPRLRTTLDFHRNPVYSVAFSPDGKTLASVGDDEKIELFDVDTGRNTATLKAKEFEIVNLHVVLFSPDGKTLATVGYCPGTVKLWDLSTGKNTITIEIVTSVTSLAFNPNGKILASTAEDGGELRLWDVATGNRIGSFGEKAWFPVAYSPNGKALASSGDRGSIKLWDAITGKSTATIHPGLDTVTFLSFSPDSRILAWSGRYFERGRAIDLPTESSKNIILWDVVNLKQFALLHGHTDEVHGIAFHPAGKVIASGSGDTTVKLWNVATGKDTYTLRAHKGSVHTVAFSADGRILASGSRDGAIKLWDMHTGNDAERQ